MDRRADGSCIFCSHARASARDNGLMRRAVVIGSGPNGLSAAITLAREGLDVEVREAETVPGGSARSAELTLPGFVHDIGSAVYPFALASPFFSKLRLDLYGLEWVHPSAPLAHPLDDGTAVVLERNIGATGANLDAADVRAYSDLFSPIVENWDVLIPDLLRPVFHVPRRPVLLARFGFRALQPAAMLAKSAFKGLRARALFAGLAAHSILKLEQPLSSAFALMLGGAAHAVGWPFAGGGAQSITHALISILTGSGGRIATGARVNTLDELDSPQLTLCGISPKGLLRIAAKQLAGRPYADLLRRFKYGPGAFKMDWALREPIPWRAKDCLRAGTVHVGGTLEEIAASERTAYTGKAPARPFVLLAQPSLFDPSRAPAGRHTAW